MNIYLLMENFDHILLFKTDCKTMADKRALQSMFDRWPGIEEWSLDMDDCDCVLRVVSYTVDEEQIIKWLNQSGYKCCELI